MEKQSCQQGSSLRPKWRGKQQCGTCHGCGHRSDCGISTGRRTDTAAAGSQWRYAVWRIAGVQQLPTLSQELVSDTENDAD